MCTSKQLEPTTVSGTAHTYTAAKLLAQQSLWPQEEIHLSPGRLPVSLSC